MKWSNFSPEELERRRLASVQACKDMERADFEKWYQARCDSRYWTYGQRCSGCDYWASSEGDFGACQHAGIVSGQDVMMSLGLSFCSAPIQPGYPLTNDGHWCANFKDDFDWSSLPKEYLAEIGAMRDGVLREKPTHSDQYTANNDPR